MSTTLNKKLSLADYFVLERRAEFKSEFFDGEMFAMAGASTPHCIIKENLSVELGTRLKGGPCRTLSSDQRLLVERTGFVTYPDLLIVCGKMEFSAIDPHTLVNPNAIIEILSPSTERYDRGTKFRNYQQIPTLTEYILVAQDELVCERFVRQGDGSWALVSFVGLEAELAFTSVPVRIPLADVYAGVTFTEPGPR